MLEDLGLATVAEFQSPHEKENVIFIHCDFTNKGNLEGKNLSHFSGYGHGPHT